MKIYMEFLFFAFLVGCNLGKNQIDQDMDNQLEQSQKYSSQYEYENNSQKNYENFEKNDSSAYEIANEEFANDINATNQYATQQNAFYNDDLNYNFEEKNSEDYSSTEISPYSDESINSSENISSNNSVNPPKSLEQNTLTKSTSISNKNSSGEIRVGRIGKPNEFSGLPTVEGSLRNMADGEAPEEYIVELGDTLYDICSQLIGEGGYWPKLWSLNSYIKNPHFIWPGMRLRFYPGDDEDPPFIEILEQREVIPIVSDEPLSAQELVAEELLSRNDDSKNIEFEIIDKTDVESAENVEIIGLPKNPHILNITIPGYILAEKANPTCLVMGGNQGESIVREGFSFLCDPQKNSLKTNQRYTALRYSSKVTKPLNEEKVGYKYQFVAQVYISAKIDNGKKALGIVEKTHLGLRRDDIIVPYRSSQRTVSIVKNLDAATSWKSSGNIVGFENFGQQLGGEGNMVYIDKGLNDGIRNGQLLKIDQRLQQFLSGFRFDKTIDNTQPIGYLRIIDTTQVASIGYILQNSREVQLGDFVGKG